MSKRSTSRRLAMQALYQMDISGISEDKALENVFEEDEFKKETREYSSRLVRGVTENIAEIDKKINEKSIGWPVSRMGVVDKNILRLAVYELAFLKENPFAVVIDEAVELAKKYSSEDAKKFINGVLSSMAVVS